MEEVNGKKNKATESAKCRIVALTTCYNRRISTLASLEDLHAQDLPDDVSLAITIVDDGSTDGTAEVVRQKFPDVEILSGNGSLYWAGGMRYGWEESVKDKSFDFLLVYNDDVRLKVDAVWDLISVSRSVAKEYGPLHAVAGGFTDRSGQRITYGGFRHSSQWHPLRFEHVLPTGTRQKIDSLNMNFSLITADALNEIGFLASYFQHNGADIEFGNRLCKTGGSIWLAPSVVGWCERNMEIGTSLEKGISTSERWRRLVNIKEEPPLQRARYFQAHGGWFWPILWASPYLRVWIDGILRAVASSRNCQD